MYLIDEEHHRRVGLDIFDKFLQAFFELALSAGTGHHAAEIEAEKLHAAQLFRHIALIEPVGEPFYDGGLARAGFAYEDGVVLCLARKNLEQAAHLGVASDHRLYASLGGCAHKVGGIAAQVGQAALIVFSRRLRGGVAVAECRYRRLEF